MERKVKAVAAWDRRPWPATGSHRAEIFHAVGGALSSWEHLEAHLSDLFASIVGGRNKLPARRAYTAVRTFEGRSEMLRAASTAYFAREQGTGIEIRIKGLLSGAINFAGRRNDIAHGYINKYHAHGKMNEMEEDRWALFPSFAALKGRELDYNPTYCMNQEVVFYFDKQFESLAELAMNLGTDLDHGKKD